MKNLFLTHFVEYTILCFTLYSIVLLSTMHSVITFTRGFKVVLSDPGPAEAREQPAAGGELGPAPGDGQDC